MSGIEREVFLDPRHTSKHLPNTPQMQRLLKRGYSAHVFNDESTMEMVAQVIIERGEYTGFIRGYERYGLFFTLSLRSRNEVECGNPINSFILKIVGLLSASHTLRVGRACVLRLRRSSNLRFVNYAMT